MRQVRCALKRKRGKEKGIKKVQGSRALIRREGGLWRGGKSGEWWERKIGMRKAGTTRKKSCKGGVHRKLKRRERTKGRGETQGYQKKTEFLEKKLIGGEDEKKKERLFSGKKKKRWTVEKVVTEMQPERGGGALEEWEKNCVTENTELGGFQGGKKVWKKGKGGKPPGKYVRG